MSPHRCGFPDASNTGPRVRTFLRVPQDVHKGRGWSYGNGVINVFGDGAVLKGLSTTVTIDVQASHVTISDSKMKITGDSWGVGLRSGSDITVTHNEIYSPATSGASRMLMGIYVMSPVTKNVISYNDIYHFSTGIHIDAGIVENNYIHHPAELSGDHLNGITSNEGTTPLTIRHNTVLNNHHQTDAISLFEDFGRRANATIDDNLLAGGTYTLYAGGVNGSSHGTPTNIRVIDNRFSRMFFGRGGYYGPATAFATGATGNVWSGNVWDDTGKPIGPPN